MKKCIAFISFICLICWSCNKDLSDTGSNETEVKGVLIYQDPASDGLGYYFLVDGTQEVILSDDFSNTKYAQYINVHATLDMIDTGQKACGGGFAGCTIMHRKVKVVRFIKL